MKVFLFFVACVGPFVNIASGDTVKYTNSPSFYPQLTSAISQEFGTRFFPPLLETTQTSYLVPGSGPVELTYRFKFDTGVFLFSFGHYRITPALSAIDLSNDAGKLAYAIQALSPGNATLIFDDEFHNPGASRTITATGGDTLGFFLLPDAALEEFQISPNRFALTGTGSATYSVPPPNRFPFFSVSDANPGARDQLMSFSGVSAVTSRPTNLFAWEDLTRLPIPGDFLPTDNQFNDLIFAVEGIELGPPTPTWNVDASGNWSQASNWSGGVPNAIGAKAVFGGAITANRTVTVDTPITVGQIEFSDANFYTVAGVNGLTLDATSGESQLNVLSGSHAISAPLALADNTVITVTPAASKLSITGALNASGKNLTKAGTGTLTLNNLRGAGLSINGGAVAIAPAGTSAGTSVLDALTIAGVSGAWTAKLDVHNNDTVLQSSAAGKAAYFTRLYNQVKQGFNNGNWQGLGITSTSAAMNLNADTGLALVDNAVLGVTTFSGQPVTADSILLKYTYYGDIDQNGQVDADDLTVFANSFGRTSGATQIDGDIDFNGAVNADDLTVFANNFNKGIGNPIANGDVQAVPEPSGMALVGIAVATLIWIGMRRSPRRSVYDCTTLCKSGGIE